MQILNFILGLIWAGLTASIVGLIWHFRKPLAAIGYALSELDVMKAGPLLLKRQEEREEGEKAARIISDLAEKSTILEHEKANEQIVILALLNMTLLATNQTIQNLLPEDKIQGLKELRDWYYKKIKSTDPTADIIKLTEKSTVLPPVEESQ